MRTKITGSLVVCAAAAVFAAGALVLNDDSPAPTPVPVAAAVTAAGSPSTQGTGVGAYNSRTGTPAGAGAAVGGGGNAARVTLQIQGFAFSPVTARAGGQVTVQNRDGVAHTVTGDGGRFDTGKVNPNTSVTLVAPAAPGSYRFTCVIHPQMSGTLVVR